MDFIVEKKIIECDVKEIVGDNDYEATFVLDDEWDGKAVKVKVVWNNRASEDIDIVDDKCTIPAHMLKKGNVSIGVFADGLASSRVNITVRESIKQDTYAIAVPHKEKWEEIQEKVANAVTQTEMTSAIETALNESGHVKESEFSSKVNDYLTEELISKSENLFDKELLQSGYYSGSANGISLVENESYACLLLDIVAGETYTMTGWGYTSSFYDKDGVRSTAFKVGNGTQSTETVTFTVPDGLCVMSVNLRLDTNDADTFMVVKGDTLPSEYIPYAWRLKNSPYVEKVYVEKIVKGNEYHVGVGQQYTSFTECIKALADDDTEKTIYVHEGTYDIFTEIGGSAFLQTITDDNVWYDVSVIIPPNTKIIGIGLVELNYLPDSTDIQSDNAVSCISPVNVRGSVYIENITINAKNCRYCIHDEASGLDEFNGNTKTFKNVRCHKFTNDYTPTNKVTSGQAYASGLNRRCKATFENCVFESDDSIAWSTHNRAFDTHDGATITLKNCVFVGGASSYGTVRFGNSSAYPSHSIVNMSECYLNGKIVVKDESTGTYYNTYDITVLNCTNVDVETSFSTDNEYPVKVYNPIPNITE